MKSGKLGGIVFATLPLSSLVATKRACPSFVREIVADYDPLALRCLIVRPEGNRYAVLDGNQRLAAMRSVGEKVALCQIVY